MTAHTIATIDEIPPGEVRKVEVDGLRLAVYNIGGEFYATADTCPHQAASFSLVGQNRKSMEKTMGRIDEENGTVHCPYHYWEFDLESGDSVAGFSSKLPTYDVEIVGEQVRIEI